MRIKEDYVVKDILGSVVIIPIGQRYMNNEKNIYLNSEGAFFVRNIKAGKSEEDIVDLYSDLFSADIDDAKYELDKFIKYGIECGFIDKE